MVGTPTATAPRMHSASATTACWHIWAETSAWSFFIADPTPCFHACTGTMRTAHRNLVRTIERPRIHCGRRHQPAATGAEEQTVAIRCRLRRGTGQRILRVVREPWNL